MASGWQSNTQSSFFFSITWHRTESKTNSANQQAGNSQASSKENQAHPVLVGKEPRWQCSAPTALLESPQRHSFTRSRPRCLLGACCVTSCGMKELALLCAVQSVLARVAVPLLSSRRLVPRPVGSLLLRLSPGGLESIFQCWLPLLAPNG